MPYSWTGKSNIVETSGLPKLIYRFNIISINFPKGLFQKEMKKFIYQRWNQQNLVTEYSCLVMLCYFNERQHFINENAQMPEILGVPRTSKLAVLLRIQIYTAVLVIWVTSWWRVCWFSTLKEYLVNTRTSD